MFKFMLPFLLALLLFSTSGAAYAQCLDNQHTDPGAVGISPGGTIYDRFSSAYHFEFNYDQSATVFIVTEPMHNAQKLRWSGWCKMREIRDLEPPQLSDTSHTESFVVQEGDQVSVYRELSWIGGSLAAFPTTYFARDTLDFAIVITDAVTGGRLALLDSIGLLRQVPTGSPTYYGSAPNAARLTWTVPPEHSGRSIEIGIRLYMRGDGEYNPGRMDRMTVNLSDRLTDVASQAGIIQPQ